MFVAAKRGRSVRRFITISASTAVILLCTACASNPQTASIEPGSDATSDTPMVKCLLPGQVRKLGTKATYITQRKSVNLSSDECTMRGGSYQHLARN